jgi:cytochrome P450
MSASSIPPALLGERFDPFNDPILTDPFPFMAEARKACPAFFSPMLNYWVVTRYRDIREILQNSNLFSASNTLDAIKPVCPHAQKVLASGFRPVKVLTNADPPAHARVRRLANAAFTRSRVAAWEPYIREVVRQVLAERFTGRAADLVKDLAYELPAVVVFKMLGVPQDRVPQAKAASTTRTLFNWGFPSDEEQVRLAEDFSRFWEMLRCLVAERAEHPQDDVISALLQAGDGDLPALTQQEVTTIVSATATAGHETTTSGIGNAMRWLLEYRHAWEEICRDASLIPNAVEELLRFDPSVNSWRRKAIDETDIGGVRVPAGANLLLLLASANRDAEVFADPDRLDIRRGNAKEHLAFGGGAHLCLGAPLARLEMKVVLEELSGRLPGLRLVPGQKFSYLPNTSFRGPLSLKVEW